MSHQTKQLDFPTPETKPIIGLQYVSKCPTSSKFPCSGLLVLTLNSIYFFEAFSDQFKANKLNLPGIFYSFKFDCRTRLLYVITKPAPYSKHLVCELKKVNVSINNTPDYGITCNVLFVHQRGGSYTEKAFSRGSIFSHPNSGHMLLAYGRGSGAMDHKLQIVPIDKVDQPVQEISTNTAVLDVKTFRQNSFQSYLGILREKDLLVYKWDAIKN